MKLILICLLFATCNKPIQVILDGSKSYDNYGKIVKYHWRQISGVQSNITHPDSVITTITGIPIHGEYWYELTVTGDNGAIDKDTTIKFIIK